MTDPIRDRTFRIQEIMKRAPLEVLLLYQMAATMEIQMRYVNGVVKEKETTRKAFEKFKR